MPPLVGYWYGKGTSGFGYNSTAAEVVADLDLTGQTFLITGVNAGLGFEAMRVLAARGASIVGLCRTVEKAKLASARAFVPPERFTAVECELSEPHSAKRAAKEVVARGVKVDAIIANAAIMALPQREEKHGVELQYLTNHVGHFILVNDLLPTLKPKGRVVVVASMAHEGTYKAGLNFDDLSASKEYSPWGAYGQSKLANVLFARELSRRLPAGQTANSLHPGVADTELGRHMGLSAVTKLFFRWVGGLIALKSVEACAATEVYMAAHPDAEGITGEYWASCNVWKSSAFGRDDALARTLWQKTEELVDKLLVRTLTSGVSVE